MQSPEEKNKTMAIEVLQKIGYEKITTNLTSKSNDIILKDILKKQITNINNYKYKGNTYSFSEENINRAVEDINIELISGLINTNEQIYDILTIKKSYQEKMVDNIKKSYDIKYIDFENIEKNIFNIVEDFEIIVEGKKIKLDIVLFINGIPIAIIECKEKKEYIEQGIYYITKTEELYSLLKFIQIILVTSKDVAKYGTCGTKPNLFNIWNEKEYTEEKLKQIIKDRKINNQDRAIISLFSQERILDIIKNYIIFQDREKKICRYQQYFTVKSILKRINEFDEIGNRKGGVVWHTQGSGKSITMAYLVKQILNQVESKYMKIIIVTDRIELDNQIQKIFNKIGIKVSKASTGQNLVELVQNSEKKIITTVINKFEAAVRSNVKIESKDVFILIDEAHRSQYGEINKKMQETFKNATYISFTGTPLMKKDKNTFEKFGEIIAPIYTINEAIKDKTIVPLYYESRMIEALSEKTITNKKLRERNISYMQETEERIQKIAIDINEHYKNNLKDTKFNAILACNSITQAFKYYENLQKIGDLKIAIITSIPDKREKSIKEYIEEDPAIVKIRDFYNNITKGYKNFEEYENITKYNFINGNIDIIIVVDKLLTGFDAPRASVLYIDKYLSGHTFLQAIARVNRVYEGKRFGYIIDYRGLLGELNKSLEMYTNLQLCDFSKKDLESAIFFTDSQIEIMQKSYKNLEKIFKTIKNKQDIEEYEIFLENEKERWKFYDELCNFANFFGVTISSERTYKKIGKQAMEKYKKALKFYQTLRKRIKIRYSEDIDHEEYEDKMQKILKTYINSNNEIKIEKLAYITDTSNFQKEYEQMKTTRAKADLIRTRLIKTIKEQEEEKSKYYEKFLKRIEEVIEKYRNKNITDEKYLKEMEKIKQDFLFGDSKIEYPKNIEDETTKVIYEEIYNEIEKQENKIQLEEIGKLSIKINEGIKSIIKKDWQNNKEVHNSIRKFIDEELYKYTTKKNMQITLEKIDNIIENILTIAIIKYN